MEEVDLERLEAYAAGRLSPWESRAFEQYCRSRGYDPQILVELLEFEQDRNGNSSHFDENLAFEQLKFRLKQ